MNGQGNWITKAFSRYLGEIGKNWPKAKRGFHSLRKTFIQELQGLVCRQSFVRRSWATNSMMASCDLQSVSELRPETEVCLAAQVSPAKKAPPPSGSWIITPFSARR